MTADAPPTHPLIGTVIPLGTAAMERDAIIAFATLYDPQPFHLDEAGAEGSVFDGLVASGIHTLAAIHGLTVRSGVLARLGSLAGLGMERVRLLRPVHPGDQLTATLEVLSVTPTHKPDRAVMICRIEATNQAGDPVITYEPTLLAQVPPPS